MTIRKQFIIDIVENWKKNYPDEYKNWLNFIEWKRSAMKDKFGSVDKEIRKGVSVPNRLYNQIIYVLDGINEPFFLEQKGEMKWFIKKFPEFLISETY